MATFSNTLSQEQITFIHAQKMFFVGSCAGGRDVNISPKGVTPLRILGANMAVYPDFHGSGNRTAEDIAEGSSVTLMFCSFDTSPYILRLFCTGEILKPGDAAFNTLLAHWDGMNKNEVRQMFLLKIKKVQSSCGYGVPVFEYIGGRKAAENLGA